jgi:hypothetical protein
MNSPQEVVENFILYFTSNDEERDQLISTLNDPSLIFFELDEDELEDPEVRVENNVINISYWIQKTFEGSSEKKIKERIQAMRSMADYIEEDHVDGLPSIEDDIEGQFLECKKAFENLIEFQADQVDDTVYRQLTELMEGMETQPSEALIKRFRTTYNYLSTKQEYILEEAPVAIGDYTITNDKLIPFDYIPVCYKIGDKVYLVGGEYTFLNKSTDDEFGMREFFDMTTEMETGHSYTFYCMDSGQFKIASKEERLAVKAFFDSQK